MSTERSSKDEEVLRSQRHYDCLGEYVEVTEARADLDIKINVWREF